MPLFTFVILRHVATDTRLKWYIAFSGQKISANVLLSLKSTKKRRFLILSKKRIKRPVNAIIHPSSIWILAVTCFVWYHVCRLSIIKMMYFFLIFKAEEAARNVYIKEQVANSGEVIRLLFTTTKSTDVRPYYKL